MGVWWFSARCGIWWVIDFQIARQGRLQLSGTSEACLLDQVTDATIETLHHAIGLRMTWRRQAVHDAHLGAVDIKGVRVRGKLIPGCKTIRELTPVVCDNLFDLHRSLLFQSAQKVGAADIRLVRVNAEIDPARCTINSHKQVATLDLFGHLGQVLDVNVHKGRLIVFEGFQGRFFPLDLWQ
jgi:hypothetical protein